MVIKAQWVLQILSSVIFSSSQLNWDIQSLKEQNQKDSQKTQTKPRQKNPNQTNQPKQKPTTTTTKGKKNKTAPKTVASAHTNILKLSLFFTKVVSIVLHLYVIGIAGALRIPRLADYRQWMSHTDICHCRHEQVSQKELLHILVMQTLSRQAEGHEGDG